jgi:hypothetical protein
MDLTAKDKLIAIPDLRHRLRQLRWFSTAFRNNAALIEDHFGLAFTIDERLLNQAFFDWVSAVDKQDKAATADRADYIVYIAGLALRELLRVDPASVSIDRGPMEGADEETVQLIRFWPEGFLYTNFCVCSVAAVHEQEFGEPRNLDKAASDLRTWWSFRENVAEDPNIAIAFFDQFLGLKPNWQFPALAGQRTAIKKALSDAATKLPRLD